MDLTRSIGNGRTLMATPAAEGGWWLVLAEDMKIQGRVRITAWQMAQVVKRGRAYEEGNLEIRGLRHETEFRVAGRMFGRIKHAEFVELIAEAELTRTPPHIE